MVTTLILLLAIITRLYWPAAHRLPMLINVQSTVLAVTNDFSCPAM